MTAAGQSCILIFIKYPEEGAVKSRLAAAAGMTHAAELYRCFVNDTIRCVTATELDYRICFTPEEKIEDFRNWLGDGRTCIPQKGANLGERMKNAFLAAFSGGCNEAVVIGSDMPDMPPSLLVEAVNALSRGFCVAGPCEDGGYYLIGFRNDLFLPSAFDNIEWSSETVMDRTIEALQAAGRKLYILPTLRDIDTIEDLRALTERNEGGDEPCPATMNYLRQNLPDLFDNR